MASLVPILLLMNSPHSWMSDNFALIPHAEDSLFPDFYHPVLHRKLFADFYKPWSGLLSPRDVIVPCGTKGEETFKVHVDVRQYKPEEINVTMVDRVLRIKGKHEEKEKNGMVSRHFEREFFLPPRVDVEHIRSSISSDGVLTVSAPCNKQLTDANVKTIQIEKTGKAHGEEESVAPDTHRPEETTTMDNRVDTEEVEIKEEP